MQENIAYNKTTPAANVSMQALDNQACDSRNTQSEVETTTHLTVTILPSHMQQADMQLDKGGNSSVEGTTVIDNHVYAILEEQCIHPHGNSTTTAK